MATNRPVSAYKTDPAFTPGTDESGMQASIESAIGYGSASAGPGKPATIATQDIGGTSKTLDEVVLPLTP